MTAPVYLDRGRIMWRGTYPTAHELDARQARRLRDIFAAEPAPYAQDYARQLEAVLAQLEPQEIAA